PRPAVPPSEQPPLRPPAGARRVDLQDDRVRGRDANRSRLGCLEPGPVRRPDVPAEPLRPRPGGPPRRGRAPRPGAAPGASEPGLVRRPDVQAHPPRPRHGDPLEQVRRTDDRYRPGIRHGAPELTPRSPRPESRASTGTVTAPTRAAPMSISNSRTELGRATRTRSPSVTPAAT